MIRAAKFGDIPGIVKVLEWAYDNSVEAGKLTFDVLEAKSVVMAMIQRHGNRNEGGTFVAVSEHDGEIEGVIAGITCRYYEVFKELEASDVWWLTTDKAPARDGVALFKAFDDWAKSHPKVRRIRPGISDMVKPEERDRKEKVLRFFGYEPFGSMWRKEAGQ